MTSYATSEILFRFRRKSLKKSSPSTVAKKGEGDVRYDTGKSKVEVNLTDESKEVQEAVYEVIDLY